MCRAVSPLFEQLAVQHPTAHFYRLDIEEVRDVALALGVLDVSAAHHLDKSHRFEQGSYILAARLQSVQKRYSSREPRGRRSYTAGGNSFSNELEHPANTRFDPLATCEEHVINRMASLAVF